MGGLWEVYYFRYLKNRLLKKEHKNKFKFLSIKILWIVLLCFSLAPCSVKNSIFDFIGISSEKPLNKNQSTINCQYVSFSENKKVFQIKSQKIINDFKFNSALTYFLNDFYVDFENPKNNSPPFYILFKRLKIAVVV